MTCSSFSYCLSCSLILYFYDNSCLDKCPNGFYGFNSRCHACPVALYCLTCLNDLQCSSCKSGYYLYNFQCLTSCPSLITYYNDANRTCDSCPSNCTNCYGNLSSIICTVCKSGYVLDNNNCYSNCISNLIAVNNICQGCSSLCKTCSIYITNCTSCYTNTPNPYLYNFNCISYCPQKYYADNSTYDCNLCNSPC